MIKTAMKDNTSEMSKQMMADIKINLASDLLVKMDIATMAHSIEARSPLLDHKLAELVFSLPEKYKTRRWRAKSLLKDAYKGRLPDEILKRPKKGFEIPVEKWLHSELRDLLHDTLLQPNSETGTYVHRRFIQDLWRKKDYVDRNWAMTVYSLLVLELWLRKNRSSIVGNRL
jgi:asparagine synthase (glutamine-hydrolysing)